MAKGQNKEESCRSQLEKDVHGLQILLQQEMELRSVLENAVEHASGEVKDLPCLPHDAHKLLSDVSMLEGSILRLEEEIESLHCHLIQERNERRIAEYWLKQLPSKTPDRNEEFVGVMVGGDCKEIIKDEKMLEDVYHTIADGKIEKEIPVKGLWNYPNQLSEEMVWWMRNIFITLAESSDVNTRLSTESEPTTSPYGHLSNSSFWSLSESPSPISSWTNSPQVDIQCDNGVLATQNSHDPYKVRGKLSWADIGSYSIAIEVSWMSVRKKQLEYAAGALRRFKYLVEQLAKVNPIHLSGNEMLAFWINLYNALMMHAYLAYGVPKSDYKLFSLMQKASYTIGGHSFSAAAIEYVVLKMKPPVHRPQTALLLALHKLKVSEVHKKFSLDTPEPLALFALSSGMYSSPAVRVYSPVSIGEQLLEAQRDYIRASVGISSKGKLLVPKMLHSFAKTHVDESKVASWISRFLLPWQAAFVEKCASQRRRKILTSRNCGVIPHDSRFRYLFLPQVIP